MSIKVWKEEVRASARACTYGWFCGRAALLSVWGRGRLLTRNVKLRVFRDQKEEGGRNEREKKRRWWWLPSKVSMLVCLEISFLTFLSLSHHSLTLFLFLTHSLFLSLSVTFVLLTYHSFTCQLSSSLSLSLSFSLFPSHFISFPHTGSFSHTFSATITLFFSHTLLTCSQLDSHLVLIFFFLFFKKSLSLWLPPFPPFSLTQPSSSLSLDLYLFLSLSHTFSWQQWRSLTLKQTHTSDFLFHCVSPFSSLYQQRRPNCFSPSLLLLLLLLLLLHKISLLHQNEKNI